METSSPRQRSATPCVGKFREEFGEPSNQSPPQKVSLFSRLHLAIPTHRAHSSRGYDGPDDISSQPRTSAPTSRPPSGKTTPSPSRRGFLRWPSGSRRHPPAGESAAELWQRAVQTEMRSRSLDTATGSRKHPLRALGGDSSTATPIETDYRSLVADETYLSPGSSGIGQGPYSGSRQSPTNNTVEPMREDEQAFQRSLVRSNTILEEWSSQRREQEFEARARSRPVVQQKCHANRLSEIPESWAKFPSHTREGRTGPAGAADRVDVRDFAVRSASAQGLTEWYTDKPGSAPGRSSTAGRRSLSARMGKALRIGLKKLIPEKRGPSAEENRSSSKRRSSRDSGGDLEYPELELLPTQGGYTELRALERDIDTLKGIGGLNCRLSPRTPTTAADSWDHSQPVELIGARLDGSPGNDDESSEGNMPLRRLTEATSYNSIPVTPGDRLLHPPGVAGHTKESTSTTIERYSTPLSRMSVYNDALSHPGSTPDTSRTNAAEADSDKSEATVVLDARRE